MNYIEKKRIYEENVNRAIQASVDLKQKLNVCQELLQTTQLTRDLNNSSNPVNEENKNYTISLEEEILNETYEKFNKNFEEEYKKKNNFVSKVGSFIKIMKLNFENEQHLNRYVDNIIKHIIALEYKTTFSKLFFEKMTKIRKAELGDQSIFKNTSILTPPFKKLEISNNPNVQTVETVENVENVENDDTRFRKLLKKFFEETELLEKYLKKSFNFLWLIFCTRPINNEKILNLNDLDLENLQVLNEQLQKISNNTNKTSLDDLEFINKYIINHEILSSDLEKFFALEGLIYKKIFDSKYTFGDFIKKRIKKKQIEEDLQTIFDFFESKTTIGLTEDNKILLKSVREYLIVQGKKDEMIKANEIISSFNKKYYEHFIKQLGIKNDLFFTDQLWSPEDLENIEVQEKQYTSTLSFMSSAKAILCSKKVNDVEQDYFKLSKSDFESINFEKINSKIEEHKKNLETFQNELTLDNENIKMFISNFKLLLQKLRSQYRQYIEEIKKKVIEVIKSFYILPFSIDRNIQENFVSNSSIDGVTRKSSRPTINNKTLGKRKKSRSIKKKRPRSLQKRFRRKSKLMK